MNQDTNLEQELINLPNTPNINKINNTDINTFKLEDSSDTEDEMESDPEYINVYTKEMADDLIKKGKYNSAINIYSKLIEDDENYLLYSNRSVAYMKVKNYNHALKDSIKTIKLNQSYAKGWGRLGAALYQLNRMDDSLKAYEKAYELENSNIYKDMIDTIKSKNLKCEFDIKSEGGIDDMISTMMNNMMKDPKMMEKLIDPNFQEKVLSMQSTPFDAFKDDDIMNVLNTLMKKIN
jgi:stress-induced-phosphoprotein 1